MTSPPASTALDPAVVESAVAHALESARAAGVRGAAVLAESGNDRQRWLRRILGYGVGAMTAADAAAASAGVEVLCAARDRGPSPAAMVEGER